MNPFYSFIVTLVELPYDTREGQFLATIVEEPYDTGGGQFSVTIAEVLYRLRVDPVAKKMRCSVHS